MSQITLTNSSTPSIPSTGQVNLFADTNNQLKIQDASGNIKDASISQALKTYMALNFR